MMSLSNYFSRSPHFSEDEDFSFDVVEVIEEEEKVVFHGWQYILPDYQQGQVIERIAATASQLLQAGLCRQQELLEVEPIHVAPTIEVPVEWDSYRSLILQPFRSEGNWNLVKIRRQIIMDMTRFRLLFNHQSVQEFETLQNLLGLSRLNFFEKSFPDVKLKEKERKSLEFLAMLQHGCMAHLFEYLQEKHLVKLESHDQTKLPEDLALDYPHHRVRHLVDHEGDLLRMRAYYNAKTDHYGFEVVQRFILETGVDKAISPILEGKVSVHNESVKITIDQIDQVEEKGS